MQNDFNTADSYVYENSTNYKRLPDWSKLLLDDYLNDLSTTFPESSINIYRIACSEFLIYIHNIDGKSTKDINHNNLIAYYITKTDVVLLLKINILVEFGIFFTILLTKN
jgi:hypothetical protein